MHADLHGRLGHAYAPMTARHAEVGRGRVVLYEAWDSRSMSARDSGLTGCRQLVEEVCLLIARRHDGGYGHREVRRAARPA